jgi:PBP1b-binding outer membrane lipoprotein LpoB
MNNHIKRAIFILISLLLISGCTKEEGPKEEVIRPVKAIQIKGPEVLTGRTFPGKAKATQDTQSFPSEGRG